MCGQYCEEMFQRVVLFQERCLHAWLKSAKDRPSKTCTHAYIAHIIFAHTTRRSHGGCSDTAPETFTADLELGG